MGCWMGIEKTKIHSTKFPLENLLHFNILRQKPLLHRHDLSEIIVMYNKLNNEHVKIRN